MVTLSVIRIKGGFYMMSPGFSGVCVSSCFWIHEQYQMTYCQGCILHPPGPCTWPSNHYCVPWKMLPSVTQQSCPVLLPERFSQSLLPHLQKPTGLSLCVLCYIFFSQICFHQFQPPISHNCFPYTPKPPPSKIKTSCFECGLLGCTCRLWPLMVLSSLCHMRWWLPHPGSDCCS